MRFQKRAKLVLLLCPPLHFLSCSQRKEKRFLFLFSRNGTVQCACAFRLPAHFMPLPDIFHPMVLYNNAGGLKPPVLAPPTMYTASTHPGLLLRREKRKFRCLLQLLFGKLKSKMPLPFVEMRLELFFSRAKMPCFPWLHGFFHLFFFSFIFGE